MISNVLNWNAFFPPYLINYFKYPVIIDGSLFRRTFHWQPKYGPNEVFGYYRKMKELG
jgi:UDP-glucose 4-epimerase